MQRRLEALCRIQLSQEAEDETSTVGGLGSVSVNEGLFLEMLASLIRKGAVRLPYSVTTRVLFHAVDYSTEGQEKLCGLIDAVHPLGAALCGRLTLILTLTLNLTLTLILILIL